MREKLFRTSAFGGYKKEDVQMYVAKLEEELVRVQAQLTEGQGLLKESGETQKEQARAGGDDIIIFDDTQEEIQAIDEKERNASPSKIPDAEKETAASADWEQELAAARQKLIEMKTQLKASNKLYTQSKKRLKLVLAEKKQLEDETARLREEQKKYEGNYDAVKEVLLNARIDAEIIRTKAKNEARALIEETHKRIEQEKQDSILELIHALNTNRNGLETSKYYLEEQVNGIECMEKQLDTIRDDLKKFLVMDTHAEYGFEETD